MTLDFEIVIIVLETLALTVLLKVGASIRQQLVSLNKRVAALEAGDDVAKDVDALTDALPEIDANYLMGDYGLTNREAEILPYLLKGRNASYISERLYISRNTVRTHINNVYKKFGVHSQQELMSCFLA